MGRCQNKSMMQLINLASLPILSWSVLVAFPASLSALCEARLYEGGPAWLARHPSTCVWTLLSWTRTSALPKGSGLQAGVAPADRVSLSRTPIISRPVTTHHGTLMDGECACPKVSRSFLSQWLWLYCIHNDKDDGRFLSEWLRLYCIHNDKDDLMKSLRLAVRFLWNSFRRLLTSAVPHLHT